MHLLSAGVFPGLISKLSSESSNCLSHFALCAAATARAHVFQEPPANLVVHCVALERKDVDQTRARLGLDLWSLEGACSVYAGKLKLRSPGMPRAS